MSVFSAHSTRSAASSKASDKGLNLGEISKQQAGLMPKIINENFGLAILSA